MGRAMVFAAVVSVFALLPAPRVPAQDPKIPSDQEVKDAIARAAEIIVAEQESYDPAHDAKGARGRSAGGEAAGEKGEPGKGGSDRAATSAPREWPYEGVYRVAPGIIPPGYRVGGTAICCLALMETPGFGTNAAHRAAFDRGIAFILDTLAKDPLMEAGFLGTYDVRGWGHAYALLTLLRALELKQLGEATTKLATERVRWLVDGL